MAEDKQIRLATKVFKTLCETIDNREWKYDKDEENLIVTLGVSGDDIPMQFGIYVDVKRQLVCLLSYFPYKMSEEKRVDGAIAINAASFAIPDGAFDYDIFDGTIRFRMAASFKGSVIGKSFFDYMIDVACVFVDEYNEKFLAIDKGFLSIEDFLKGLPSAQ